MSDILSKGYVPQDELTKANIAANFKNAGESLLPEDARLFQVEVKKGEVEILTKAEFENDFGGQMMYKANHAALGAKLDELIEKGKNPATPLNEEEAEFVEKGSDMHRAMLRKALPIHKDGTEQVLGYLEVFVAPKIEDETV